MTFVKVIRIIMKYIANNDHLQTGRSDVINRDNADITHQVTSEIAIETGVVVDDRGHDQTVIAVTSHQNATQHLIQQDTTECHQ